MQNGLQLVYNCVVAKTKYMQRNIIIIIFKSDGN